MTHIGFAGVFFFLSRQRTNRFARYLTWSWVIEAVRAAILIPSVHGAGAIAEVWFALGDALCVFANWYLLAGCADLAGKRLPRWLAPTYFWSSLPLLLFNRFVLPTGLLAIWGVPLSKGHFAGIAVNLFALFIPVAVTRLVILGWMYSIWKKRHLSGALLAAAFALPYGLVAMGAPFQFLYSYNPSWLLFLWCVRVIGFSIALMMLLLSIQQEALVGSEKNLMTAQALAKLGSWEMDLATGLAHWSAEMYRLWGREPSDDLLTRGEFLSAIDPGARELFAASQLSLEADRGDCSTEFKLLAPNGSVRWLQARSTPVRNDRDKIVALAGTVQDVTERKRAEARTDLQHAVTRVLAEGAAVQPTLQKVLEIVGRGLEWDFGAVWMCDRTTKVLRCSEIWHAASDRTDAFTEVTRNAVFSSGEGLPGSVLAARASLSLANIHGNEDMQRRAVAAGAGLNTGIAFPLMARAEVLGVVEFFSTRFQQPDGGTHAVVTALGNQIGQFIERQRLEEQYRQAQRMEAVGTLAGGIAHDFNNILTAINGYSELARFEAQGNSRVGEHLRAVQEATRRATDLVRQIMAFSRQEELVRVPTHLQQIVDEALKLLRATIPSTVEINCHFGKAISPVLANATSIHQVVVNLATNAWHAMKGQTGRIEITVEDVRVDEDLAAMVHGLKRGPHVCLTMTDTGHGMDELTLARIFEPFFTTKRAGEGTGLGLAVVHGIVQSHEGAIAVSSRPGEGTRFSLYFPSLVGRPAAPKHTPIPEILRGHGERILYVDDEKSLADMGKKILERLGYVVETFYDPKEALAAIVANRAGFNLVVTDLTMPTMTGLEFATQLQVIRPNLPIVLTTGYAAALTPTKFQSVGVREVLVKPHSVETLAAAVARALAGSGSSAMETVPASGDGKPV